MTSSSAILHPSFRPFATEAQIQQAPAFETIPEYLTRPLANGYIPPKLLCGYRITTNRLHEIGAERYAYSRATAGDSHNVTAIMRFIRKDISNHPAILKSVWYEGRRYLFLSLCSSWKPSARLKEVEPKLKEIMGEEGPPMWHLTADPGECEWTAAFSGWAPEPVRE